MNSQAKINDIMHQDVTWSYMYMEGCVTEADFQMT